MTSNSIEAFGLSCPSGGNFYVCQGNATEFMGCCTTNPCADGSGKCPSANLRTASFAAETYADLPRQDCDDARSFNIWYTCKFNQPPFVGCCNTNPCAEGSCPRADLVPAKLSGDTGLRKAFLSPTITGAAASSTATAEGQIEVSHSSGLSAGAIGGIVAGAAVLVIVVIGALMYRCGRKASWRRERRADWPLMSAYDGETGEMASASSPYSGSCSSGFTWGGKRSPYSKENPYRSPKHERFPSSATTTDQQASPRLPLSAQGSPIIVQSAPAPVELVAPIPSELEASPYNTPELDGTARIPMISGGSGSAFSSREPSPVPPAYIASEFSQPQPIASPQRLGRSIAPALRDEKSRSASRGRIRRVERIEDFRPAARGLSQGP